MHTRESAAQYLEDLDPESTGFEPTPELRAIADAVDAVRAADSHLREAVEAARALGWSWNFIALALGVSRQAARSRFATHEPSRSSAG
jgi:hypothetical protein